VDRCTWTLGTSGVAALLGDLLMVIRDFQGGFGSIPRDLATIVGLSPKIGHPPREIILPISRSLGSD
jgi:hypothetical protein